MVPLCYLCGIWKNIQNLLFPWLYSLIFHLGHHLCLQIFHFQSREGIPHLEILLLLLMLPRILTSVISGAQLMHSGQVLSFVSPRCGHSLGNVLWQQPCSFPCALSSSRSSWHSFTGYQHNILLRWARSMSNCRETCKLCLTHSWMEGFQPDTNCIF